MVFDWLFVDEDDPPPAPAPVSSPSASAPALTPVESVFPKPENWRENFDSTQEYCGCDLKFVNKVCASDGTTFQSQCLYACNAVRNSSPAHIVLYGQCPQAIVEQAKAIAESRKKNAKNPPEYSPQNLASLLS